MNKPKIKLQKDGICAPKGFFAAGVHSGFKKRSFDLAVIYSDKPCIAAAVYTTNKVFAAPIAHSKNILKDFSAQAILANSGNANACTMDGKETASLAAGILAEELGVKETDIILASTGVIGVSLPTAPFTNGVPKCVRYIREQIAAERTGESLKEATKKHSGSLTAAKAIMTTDTVPKEIAVSFKLDGKTCRIGGIAKGSGMINPKMATMLSFITTDARLDGPLLQKCLREAIAPTFNQISVDGDMSTNDMVSILANGQSGIDISSENSDIFTEALTTICEQLARSMARDGEGATKLIVCEVKNGPSLDIARAISKSVISSNLVKTAIFGKDANWGRILCAIGYTAQPFSAENVDISLKGGKKAIAVCKNSRGLIFSEAKALEVLEADEIEILVDLHDGKETARAYGCDLTYNYVRINGAYRT